MKVLVTGGAGFIGSNLALTLQEKGYRVTVIDSFRSGNRANLDGFSGKILSGDISDHFPLEQSVPEAEFIFHQASITDTTLTDEGEMDRCNVGGFRRLLAFVAEKKIPLVYASSAGIYGDGKTPMKEDQPPKPLNSYARSKMTMDQLAGEQMKKGDIPLLVGLRYFNVFGPRERFKGKAASMIYQLSQQMRRGKRPRIFIDGEQKRDHIYVNDVVEANLKAMTAKRSGIINVGTGAATTFNRLIQILNEVLKTSLEPDYFKNPYTGVYQDETLADTRLTRELIGFNARYSIEEGIREYLSCDRR